MDDYIIKIMGFILLETIHLRQKRKKKLTEIYGVVSINL